MENNLRNDNKKYQVDNKMIHEKKKEIILNAIKQELKMQKMKFDEMCHYVWPYFIILYALSLIVGNVMHTINGDIRAGFARELAGIVMLVAFGIFLVVFWSYALILAFIKGWEAMNNDNIYNPEQIENNIQLFYILFSFITPIIFPQINISSKCT